MTANVFVLGLDEFNGAKLEPVARALDVRIVPLLDYRDVREVEKFPVEELLDRARRVLDGFDGSVDAICAFWDFPVAEMKAVLCAERGLEAPSLEAVLRLHHKWWSREIQRGVVPHHVPEYRLVDPFNDPADLALDLPYPYWIKPVRSFRSYLGFRVDDQAGLATALGHLREGIDRIADPFERILGWADLPTDVARAGGRACIAEALVGGHQCTLEGWVQDGEVHAWGVVDSIRVEGGSSFARYQYPSSLPVGVQERMQDVTRRVLEAAEYDDSPFNAEFFWDEATDQLWLLEVNTRISQSHGELFERVDGVSNHRMMVEVALGRSPQPPRGAGPYSHAAKCFVRSFAADAVVVRAPTPEEVAAVEAEVPGTSIVWEAPEGTALSGLADQDSYSWELGAVFVAGDSPEDLDEKFARCVELLPFHLDQRGS